MSVDRYHQALSALLPTGWAWPRDPGSVWMRLIRAEAATLAELDDLVQLAAQEWLPHATRTRLEEWEEAAGLPDACFGPAQSVDARRAALLARLRGFQGQYVDSSPAAPGAIAAFCAALGQPATVVYNVPFRVGRDRCGDRLGRRDGRLHVLVAGAASEPFRVGRNRCGDRLVIRPLSLVQLACALEAVVPARFSIEIGEAP